MSITSENAPQIIEHSSKSVTFTPFETRWVPCSAKFTVMGVTPRGKGVVKVMHMEKGVLNTVAEAEMNAGVKCGTFAASAYEQRHLATGDYDGMFLEIFPS